MKLVLLLVAVASAQLNSPYCPDKWTFENATNACYFLSDILLTFDQAIDYCTQSAATLSTIYSYSDKNAAIDFASNTLATPWLGARKGDDGVYKNIDNTSLYTYWLNGEPNADGACVSQRGIAPVGMKALPCYSLQPALCRQEASTCNGGKFGSQYTRSGNITSPNYPNHYFNNLDCLYLITSPNVTYITINFDPYFVEDNYDTVTLYDGNTTDSPVVGKISYTNNTKKSFESSGNQLLVRFKTDRSVVRRGWLASWNAKTFQADVTQTGEGGNFSSTNYPDDYPSYSEQYYKFIGTDQFQISLTLTDFLTEAYFDKLYIYDGPSVNSTTLVANLSGIVSTPYNLVSSTNYLTMMFWSDGSNQKRGFTGFWNIV